LTDAIQTAIRNGLKGNNPKEVESGTNDDLRLAADQHGFATALAYIRERDPLPVHPWFEFDGTRYSCPQIPRIGFYFAAQIMRSVLMASNSYAAGELVLNEGYNGPAIQLLYTAAYHLLYGWLAAHGRLIVDIPQGKPSAQVYEMGCGVGHEELEVKPQRMVVCRTKAHKWRCTKAQRSHGMIWAEVAQAVGQDPDRLPEYFQSFLKYVEAYGPVGYELTKTNLVNRLQTVSDIRHEAQYATFGYDAFAYYEIVNGDLQYGGALDLRMRNMHEFCAALFHEVSTDAASILSMIKNADGWTQSRLRSSVMGRPFEIPSEKIAESAGDIAEVVEEILDWAAGYKNSVCKGDPN